MIIYVKNMVCVRCKMLVKLELVKMGLTPIKIELGEAEIEEELSPQILFKLDAELKKWDLEILNDHKKILMEKIKALIVELIHNEDLKLKVNLSDYLSDKMNHSYGYLNNVFYKFNGYSIEKYLIAQRIEYAKELLAYHDLNLTEIAYRLNYSSLAYLSSQFKKVTGINPSDYRCMAHPQRVAIDKM